MMVLTLEFTYFSFFAAKERSTATSFMHPWPYASLRPFTARPFPIRPNLAQATAFNLLKKTAPGSEDAQSHFLDASGRYKVPKNTPTNRRHSNHTA